MQKAQENYVPKEELKQAQESENYLRTMISQLDKSFKAEKMKNELLESQLNDIKEGKIITRQVQGKYITNIISIRITRNTCQ